LRQRASGCGRHGRQLYLVVSTSACRGAQADSGSSMDNSHAEVTDAQMIGFRDLIAAVVAVVLFLGALSLATTLTFYRKRRRRTRDEEQAQGRHIIAEIPGDDDLRLFTEDNDQFHYGTQAVDKHRIVAVRVLINGVPIAACVARRFAGTAASLQATSFEDR